MKPINDKNAICRDCYKFCRKTMSNETQYECKKSRKCQGSGCKFCLYNRCVEIAGLKSGQNWSKMVEIGQKPSNKVTAKCKVCDEMKQMLPKNQICTSCKSFFQRHGAKV